MTDPLDTALQQLDVPAVQCLTPSCCGAWGRAYYAWPDGLTFAGMRCEPCARRIAERRAGVSPQAERPRRGRPQPRTAAQPGPGA